MQSLLPLPSSLLAVEKPCKRILERERASFSELNLFLDSCLHLFANYIYQLFALFLSFVSVPVLSLLAYIPSHSSSICLTSLFPFKPPTPPSRLHSFYLPAHCGDESFEQRPKALPLGDLRLSSPPPFPSSSSSSSSLSSSAPLAVFECGMLLAHTAHYPAGSVARSSQHQKQIDDCL